jgi:hypothetical protein
METKPKIQLTPAEKRELALVGALRNGAPDRAVVLSARQISLAAAMPLQSVGAALERAERDGSLVPVIPKTRAYRACDLVAWCDRNMQAVATRLSWAASARSYREGSTPQVAAVACMNEYMKELLAQPK